MSKTAHILCMEAGHGPGAYAPETGFTVLKGKLSDTLTGNLWIGPRQVLEGFKPVEGAGGPLSGVMAMFEKVTSAADRGMSVVADLVSDALAGAHADAAATVYPTHVQVIPYYLFRYRGEFLSYERPVTGNDDRLHGKISIGIGGHVDLKDVEVHEDGSIDLESTLVIGGKREALEELGIDIAPRQLRWIGTIYATDTEVDRVHVGIVGIYDLDEKEHAALDVNHEIGQHTFATLGALQAVVEGDETKTLETWTRLIIESNPLA